MRKISLILLVIVVCSALSALAGDTIEKGQAPELIFSDDGLSAYRNFKIQQPADNDNGAILDIPENDDCMNATEISGFFENLAWDNRQATYDGPGECIVQPNVWYLYTATITGSIQISTWDINWNAQTAIDTRLAVYDGSVCPVAETDPTIQEIAGGETIETAVPISGMLPLAYSGTTTGHQHDYDLGCVWPNMDAPDVVYSYTATFDGNVTFSLCGSQEDFNTALAIYDSDGYELICNDDGSCPVDSLEIHSNIISYPVNNGETYYIVISGGPQLGGYFYNYGEYLLTISSPDYYLIDCNPDYGNWYSQITLDVEADHQYLIEVGGDIYHTTGCGVLHIWPTPDPPVNDDCENAVDIGVIEPGVPATAEGPTNTGATIDCPAINEVPEVWVKFTLEEEMDLHISFCGSGYPEEDSVNGLFQYFYTYLTSSCPCDLDPIIADFSWFDSCEPVTNFTDFYADWFDLPSGDYWFPVASYIGNLYDFQLTITGLGTQGCSEDALFGQNPSENGEDMYFYNSDENINFSSAERFSDLADTINQITWWGTMLNDDLSYCVSDQHPFQIVFCGNNLNNPSIPGDTLAVYDVTASPELTGVMGSEGFDEMKCVANLTPPFYRSSGWIIIQGQGDNGCYFFWQDATEGSSAQYNHSDGQWTALSHDLAFCLNYDPNVAINDSDGPVIPERIMLSQNYPNPFNAETSIQFALRKAGEVTLTIYDINGRLVKTVYDGNLNAGNHSMIWNGTSDSGEKVSSGMYFYHLKCEEGTVSKRMVLLK